MTDIVTTVDTDINPVVKVLLESKKLYEDLMGLVESGHPLFDSYDDSERVAVALGNDFFRNVEWYKTHQYEQIAKLPVPFLNRIFSEKGGGWRWSDAVGAKLLNGGYLSEAKMKRIFIDMVRNHRKYIFGNIVYQIDNSETLLLMREAFRECFPGEEFGEKYRGMFLKYLTLNRACPLTIALEIVEANSDGSIESMANLGSLFHSIDFADQEKTGVLLPAIMEVYPNKRELVRNVVTLKGLSDELKADAFIRYYAPPINDKSDPFADFSRYFQKDFNPVVKIVRERLSKEARVLLPEVELESVPFSVLVETLAVGDAEGYKYLLECW